MFTSILLTALSLSSLARASPFAYPRSADEIPLHARMLSLDERSGVITAYDAAGVNLGTFSSTSAHGKQKRNSGNCVTLSTDEVQQREFVLHHPCSVKRSMELPDI